MAICVIANKPFIKPDDFFGAKSSLQHCVHIFLAHARIAVFVQQALARGDERSFPVGFERPALADEIIETDEGRPRQPGDDAGDAVILRQPVFPAPAIEAKLEAFTKRSACNILKAAGLLNGESACTAN